MQARNSLTPPFDPVPMVVIDIRGDMITARKNQRIRTRNYADWKQLKNGCRKSVTCDDSEDEDAFDPDVVPAGECRQSAEQASEDCDPEQRHVTRDRSRRNKRSRQQRTPNIRTSFVISTKETAS